MGNLNIHLIKALENYPYNMEECLEALKYAQSSDDQSALTHCLMGRIYAEQLHQYEDAKICFQEAMAEDMQLIEIYPDYINTLIQNEDYKEAEKLIEFAFTVKGLNKGTVWFYKIFLAEKMGEYKMALEHIKHAICEGFTSGFITHIEDMEKRIKKKKDIKSKENKSEKKEPAIDSKKTKKEISKKKSK